MKTSTIPVKPNLPHNYRELRWLERLTHVMDNAIRIPGTKYRIGADPILGLIPGVGEIVTFGISSLMVLSMVKHGVSGKVAMMMVGNVLLDSTIGAIPIIGDLFDVAYKSNQRNLNLLKKHQLEGKYQGSGIGIIIGVSLALLAILAGVIYGLVKIGEWVFAQF